MTRKVDGEVYRGWRAKDEDGAEKRPAEETERRNEVRKGTGRRKRSEEGNRSGRKRIKYKAKDEIEQEARSGRRIEKECRRIGIAETELCVSGWSGGAERPHGATGGIRSGAIRRRGGN